MSTDYESELLAAMESGFEGTQPAKQPDASTAAPESTATPEAPEAQAEQTAEVAEAEAAPEPKQETDEFAGLPPKVKEMLAEMQALRQAAALVPVLEQRLRKTEGRLGDLNSRIPVPPQPKTPQQEAFERVEQDLPEVVEAVRHMLGSKPQPEQTQEAAEELPTPVLDEERPNWRQELHSTEFQLWLAQQPAEYAQKVKTTDREAVLLAAMGKFDAQQAAHKARQEAERQAAARINQTRQTRTAAAVVPTGARRAPASTAMTFDAAMEEGFRAASGA